MTAVWDAMFPTLRLEGAGARGFLQGQTSADLKAAPTGALIQSCWLTATGRVQALLNLNPDRIEPEAYAFQQPVSPHWAAEQDGISLNPDDLVIPHVSAPLVVETAGGLMVPLTRQWLQIDQLQRWDLPIVLVARSGLGTLNHTLLSLEALNRRQLTVLGLILNGPAHADNPGSLEQFGGVPVLAHLPPLAPLSAESLAGEWRRQDLSSKFQTLLGTQQP